MWSVCAAKPCVWTTTSSFATAVCVGSGAEPPRLNELAAAMAEHARRGRPEDVVASVDEVDEHRHVLGVLDADGLASTTP